MHRMSLLANLIKNSTSNTSVNTFFFKCKLQSRFQEYIPPFHLKTFFYNFKRKFGTQKEQNFNKNPRLAASKGQQRIVPTTENHVPFLSLLVR